MAYRKGTAARMKSIVVVGAQWGDEGKGKVVDYMAASFDYIARCAGGHNAGHTVIFNGSRFVLQLIPCGILRPGKHAVIGAGVVVDPAALVAELDSLGSAGIDVRGRLHLSIRAHLIFPYHRQMEKAAEAARGAAKIGTTSRGIGPGLRRQDGAQRAARVRFDGAGALPRKARARGAGKRRHVPRGVRRAARSRGPGRASIWNMPSGCGRWWWTPPRCVNRVLDEGPFGAFRGRAGHHAGHRLRHLSLRDLLECHCRRRLHRPGRGAHANHGRRRRDQGLHHARGQRAISHGDARSRGARSARPRQGVRRRHRTPAPLRLARSGHPALRRDGERNHFAGGDQARRLRYAARNSGVRRLLLQGLADARNARRGRGFRSTLRPEYRTLPGWQASTEGMREANRAASRTRSTT